LMVDHCEICGARERLVPDHDHTTGKFRGTLCGQCNCGLGMLGDTRKSLMRAVEYIS
jgi:hypothetical protein